MGALTMAQMETLVKRAVNNRTDLNTEIAQMINQAYMETAAIRGLHFNELDSVPHTFNTVDGTRSYSFEEITTHYGPFGIIVHAGTDREVMAVYGVYNTTRKYPLKPNSLEEFAKRDTTVEGAPRWYAHMGSYLELDPTPDAVYTISYRYRLRPNRLTTGAAVATELPEEFDMPIVWYAASLINGLIGQLDKSSFYLSMRREALSNVKVALEETDDYEDFALAPSV